MNWNIFKNIGFNLNLCIAFNFFFFFKPLYQNVNFLFFKSNNILKIIFWTLFRIWQFNHHPYWVLTLLPFSSKMPLPPPSHITFAHNLLQITMHNTTCQNRYLCHTTIDLSLSLSQTCIKHACVSAYKTDVI